MAKFMHITAKLMYKIQHLTRKALHRAHISTMAQQVGYQPPTYARIKIHPLFKIPDSVILS